MAKRKNRFEKVDLKTVREELRKNVDYLRNINVEAIEDEIDYITIAGGTQKPSIISSIEQKLNSFMVLTKASIEQLKYIVEADDQITLGSQDMLDFLKSYLIDMENYFKSRNPTSMSTRYKEVTCTNAKGKPYVVKLIGANVPTQLTTRTKILEIILQSQILVSQIENFQQEEEKEAKGGGDISFHMLQIIKNNART